ncbi:helix-turn-helix transcriptional regulator [Paraburkholderia azotifigens]|uniref:helix-turn-helix transcriptional regulator n=1 Tax=Paraburkholderia azotifigens TaxID=2057004 RepID=UPI00316EBF4C
MSKFEGKDSGFVTGQYSVDLGAVPMVTDSSVLVSANADGLRLLLRPFSCRLLASVVRQGPPPYEMFVEGWLSTEGSAEHCTQAVEIHFRFGERAAHTQWDSASDEAGIPERIHSSATFLKSNLEHLITVADVARTVAMSERNFLRRFRQEFGMTPSEYLLQTRLQKSCQLLVESELPVDKIARRCGMTSGTRLAKIFRKRFGMSPTEYRLQNGKSPRALVEA